MNIYPLVRLTIPIILGMSVADYVVGNISYMWFVGMMGGALVGMWVSNRKKNYTRHPLAFELCTALFCFLLGLYVEDRAQEKAIEQYGDGWKYEIYKNSTFQIENSSKAQEKLHSIYVSQSVTGVEGDIIEAMTIGWRGGLGKETKTHFSKAGISHILALSGFHLSIIYLILQYLFIGKIRVRAWRIISNILILACLWLYSFVAGMPPSLVRAVIMCSIFIVSSLFERDAISLNSCAMAALIILFFDPLMLHHVGFQLSFMSVIGICILGIPLCKMANIQTKQEDSILVRYTVKIANGTVSVLLISLACNIFTIPIVAYTFHQIPLLSLVSNLLTTIFVSLLMLTAAVWWGTLWISWTTPFLTLCMKGLATIILKIATAVSSLPFSVYPCHPSLVEAVLMYFMILSGCYCLYKRDSKSVIWFLSSIILWTVVAICFKIINAHFFF